MHNPRSYADIVYDWEVLLEAVEENLKVLPDVELERGALQQILEKARGLKARQESLTERRKRVTQELTDLLGLGRDLALQLRAAARLKLGPRNERLARFRVAPLRGRPRRGTVELPESEAPAIGRRLPASRR